MLKIFKNFKENIELEKQIREVAKIQYFADEAKRKYDRWMMQRDEEREAMRSTLHFYKERIKELEQKVQVYEELILKGKLNNESGQV